MHMWVDTEPLYAPTYIVMCTFPLAVGVHAQHAAHSKVTINNVRGRTPIGTALASYPVLISILTSAREENRDWVLGLYSRACLYGACAHEQLARFVRVDLRLPWRVASISQGKLLNRAGDAGNSLYVSR